MPLHKSTEALPRKMFFSLSRSTSRRALAAEKANMSTSSTTQNHRAEYYHTRYFPHRDAKKIALDIIFVALSTHRARDPQQRRSETFADARFTNFMARILLSTRTS